jgi:hypothetical protein
MKNKTTNERGNTMTKKQNETPNVLKALKIKVMMPLNNDKEREKDISNQLNNYLLKKVKQGYFN